METKFSSLSTPELVAQITTLAGHLNAANACFLALIAELDRRGGWTECGVKNCAHWLNWKCGIALGAAREKVRTARALEGLPLLAESFLATGPRDLSGSDRQQIVVHVDAETFNNRTASRCELEHGPAIAAETARRLACDAGVVRIVENAEGEPLDVGRKTRTIPPGIRRALTARDKGCRFPGCSFKRYVDGHHVQHWADGGETKLPNLVTLCHFHHRLVHEGQVVVQTLDDGAFRFVKPDGESFQSLAPEPTDWSRLVAATTAAITPATAVTRWTGERLDLGLAIECLLQRREQRVSAETSGDPDGNH